MEQFSDTVWQYYKAHGRHDLPWRQPEANGELDPYKVLVSEIMLQQTQVSRVIPKFYAFIDQFPALEALAQAPLSDVLKFWSGLGYNRRAKFLWQTAGVVVTNHAGRLPQDSRELVTLPGIGYNTAGALLAYAYNRSVVFVETNIRTVFIYHFFAGQAQVGDTDIARLVAKTLPDDTRQWYWALMDYGTHLKQTVGNLNKLSKHYAKQSAFVGSNRQVRGAVVRLLVDRPLREDELQKSIADERLGWVLEDLLQEGLIDRQGTHYKLADS